MGARSALSEKIPYNYMNSLTVTDLLVQPPREPPLQLIQRSGIVQTGILTTHHAFDRVLDFPNGFSCMQS